MAPTLYYRHGKLSELESVGDQFLAELSPIAEKSGVNNYDFPSVVNSEAHIWVSVVSGTPSTFYLEVSRNLGSHFNKNLKNILEKVVTKNNLQESA